VLRTSGSAATATGDTASLGRVSPNGHFGVHGARREVRWHTMPQDINTNSPEDLEKLLLSATEELEAMKPELFVRRVVSRGRAVELSEFMRASWAPLLPLIDKELAPERAEQRKAEFKRLDTRAWVHYAADLAAEEVDSNVNKKHRKLLAKEVKDEDQFLMGWATLLFGSDPGHAATLRDISRGTGLRDDAEDVVRLVKLFRANWSKIKNKQKYVTKAYLDKAAADSARQLSYLRDGMANPARKLADAAYSLWYYDYDELMQLGRYLTRREEDSTLRFPGIRELPAGATELVVVVGNQQGQEQPVDVEDDEDDEEQQDDVEEQQDDEAQDDEAQDDEAQDDEAQDDEAQDDEDEQPQDEQP
jgi:hypothetical protein